MLNFFMGEIVILADLLEFLVKIYAHGIPSMSNLKIEKKSCQNLATLNKHEDIKRESIKYFIMNN